MTRKEVMCHQCIEPVHCIDNRRIVMYSPFTERELQISNFLKGGSDAR
ncbi:hypothetical protein ES703_30852 [subsurface metagenome]